MIGIKEAVEKNDPTFSGSIVSPAEDSDSESEPSPMAGKLILTSAANMSIEDANKVNVDFSSFDSVKVYKPDTTDAVTNLIGSETSKVEESVQIKFSEVPKDGDTLQIDGLTITFTNNPVSEYTGGIAAGIDVTNKDVNTIVGEINNILISAQNDFPAISSSDAVGSTLIVSTDRTADGASNGLDISLKDSDYVSYQGKDLTLDFQIGANSSESLSISLSMMDAASLGIGRDAAGEKIQKGDTAAKGVNVMTADAANMAIDVIDDAIKLVSAERSKLGAIQNRLEYTTTNLQTANENLTSAESRIRDLDMAEEMTMFTKNNILNQAGQAMLAQANQLPQGILQLLQ